MSLSENRLALLAVCARDATSYDFGSVTLKKGGKSLKLTFVDTGLADVNLMLIGIGVKLDPNKVDPKAKVTDSKSKPKADPDDDPQPAKKMAKKKPKSDSDDAPATEPVVVEPERKEKPKQGIAKLSKLPNEAKATGGDQTVALTHIIAYEIISNGPLSELLTSNLERVGPPKPP